MPSQYELRPYGSPGNILHSQLLEFRQEGESWLAAQRPATTWEGAVALMQEGDTAAEASSMSNTQYPKAKRIARELVASLAAFKHAGEYVVSYDNSLYDQAHLLTDLDYNWEMTTMPGVVNRQVLQNAVIKGTGYWWQEWDKNYWGPGRGDIRLQSLDPSDVTFVQLPRDNDLQRAYMVIIRVELPINLAKRIWAPINAPFAAALVPDQASPSWLEKGLQKVQQFLSPALRVAGRTRQNAQGSFPTVNIYYGYTMDGSHNEGFEPVTMGAYGTNWSYTVPPLGGEVPTDVPNPLHPGMMMTRPAKWEDTLLFPLRRLSIWSNTGIAYDGSSPWWHGDVPVAQLKFNDLPWEALGGSLISDVRTMQQGVQAMMRNAEDSSEARLNPAALYDDTLVSQSWAEKFNPRMGGARAAAPLMQGDPIKFPVDPRTFDVPQWIFNFMEAQENRMDYLTGVRDLVAMAKAKQIPGADTLEKLLEMAGPIVQDLIGAVVVPQTKLGEWRKSDYFQFYSDARVIRTVGPDDIDLETWQKYPEKIQDEIRQHKSYQFRPEMLLPIDGSKSLQQRRETLKRFMSEFRYEVTESGINELNRMTTKLMYLQLSKEGFPLSWWTMAKVFRIPNFGPPPEGTNTEIERWIAQQWLKIDLQADLQKELAQAMGQLGEGQVGPQAAGGEIPPIPALGEEQRGRPQSYKRPPSLVQKDHGTRSTITTA